MMPFVLPSRLCPCLNAFLRALMPRCQGAMMPFPPMDVQPGETLGATNFLSGFLPRVDCVGGRTGATLLYTVPVAAGGGRGT